MCLILDKRKYHVKIIFILIHSTPLPVRQGYFRPLKNSPFNKTRSLRKTSKEKKIKQNPKKIQLMLKIY